MADTITFTSMSPLHLAIISFAAHRITRLLTADDITAPIRHILSTRFASHPHLTYLLDCPWCVGFWVSAVLILTLDTWFLPIPLPPLTIAAVSSVVGIVAKVVQE